MTQQTQRQKTFMLKDIADALKRGAPYWLQDGRAIMEHLVGGTVESVRSGSLCLFAGRTGNMYPVECLTFDKALAIIKGDLEIRMGAEVTA